MSSHIFAIHLDNPTLERDNILIIREKSLIHRIINILRVHPGDKIQFFSDITVYDAVLYNVDKKELRFKCDQGTSIKPLSPEITYYIPLLYKENLEAACAAMVSAGVQKIQPFICNKSRVKYVNEKELERIRRCMIAAAEQSKQFYLPIILPVVQFAQLSDTVKTPHRFWFDGDGKPFVTLVEYLKEYAAKKPQEPIALLSGPEADLLHYEKEHLLRFGWQQIALTPTVLKSTEAIFASAVLVRSCL